MSIECVSKVENVERQLEKNNVDAMDNVINVMTKMTGTDNPLQLCRLILNYLNMYVDKLQKLKYCPEKSQKLIKLEIRKNNENVQKIETNTLAFEEILKLQKKIQSVNFKEDDDVVILPTRKTKWVKNISIQQQKLKFKEQKFIALSFIQYGINYHYITQYFPSMPPKTYRCYVEAVNNQNINQIVDFLRYQCKMQVQRLNRDQKRSIRTQLTKIKQWLGNIDKDQLSTFYQFIRRHYDKKIVIDAEKALVLYKTIIQIIKSPYVNVLEAEEAKEVGNDNELNKEEVKAMIILYKKSKDLNKVADGMCQKYGYELRYSLHSVKNKIRQLLNASLDKLVCNLPKEMMVYKEYFDDVQKRKLLQQSNQNTLKILMLDYCLQKRNNHHRVNQLLTQLQLFFDKNFVQAQISVSAAKIQQTNIQNIVKKQEVFPFQMSESVVVKLQKFEEIQNKLNQMLQNQNENQQHQIFQKKQPQLHRKQI